MKNSLILGLAALIASASLITPTVAKADTLDRQQFADRVSYADLDLSTAAGQARLEARVAAKVRQLCDSGTRDLRSRVMQAECIDQTRQKAEREIRLAVANFNSKARRA